MSITSHYFSFNLLNSFNFFIYRRSIINSGDDVTTHPARNKGGISKNFRTKLEYHVSCD